jgi:hypothetical protein
MAMMVPPFSEENQLNVELAKSRSFSAQRRL